MPTEDSTERYHADLEHASNVYEDEYFSARPNRDSEFNRMLFSAGFERAFKFLWDRFMDAEADALRLHRELMDLKYPGSVPQQSEKP